MEGLGLANSGTTCAQARPTTERVFCSPHRPAAPHHDALPATRKRADGSRTRDPETTTPPTAARLRHMPALRRREAAPPLPHGSKLPGREVQPLSRTTAGELTAEGRAAQDDRREFVLHGWRHDWTLRKRVRRA